MACLAFGLLSQLTLLVCSRFGLRANVKLGEVGLFGQDEGLLSPHTLHLPERSLHPIANSYALTSPATRLVLTHCLILFVQGLNPRLQLVPSMHRCGLSQI